MTVVNLNDEHRFRNDLNLLRNVKTLEALQSKVKSIIIRELAIC